MSWRQFIFSPESFDQSALLAAAGRAGCTGVLALDAIRAEQAAAALKYLCQNESGVGFAVSVRSPHGETVRSLLSPVMGRGLKGVVLTDPACESLADSIAWCRTAGLEPLVEITTLGEALRAVECGAEGLFAKGSESGGKVAEETTFILLQRILPRVRVPVYARGGIGLHTASACLAAGAAGVALDWQLALAEESTLPEAVRERIARMDGSETAILGQDSKIRFRAYSRVGETAYFDLKKFEESHGVDGGASPERLLQWKQLVNDRVRNQELLLIGQDAAFAKDLAEEFHNVKGICRAIRAEASRQVRVASRLNPLGENAPLAKSQGTRFPIFQGPMTRVSDNADFALAVAKGGAVPYLAFALMRGPEVAKLLDETRNKLGRMPWGVGILGFVPEELRDEQLAEIRKCKPSFLIIAGGRPDMAKQMESEGIQVYLHAPSPALARNFLEQGSRRLIFEGRECGGHVGPRTSFVLWEQMTRVILEYLQTARAGKPEDYHIIFAGGVHDARSGAMLSAIAAPLAERGVRVGAVIGTGYLFTREIVSSGAITATFQEEALACQDTLLVESGVGHATRCAGSQFAVAFADLKQRLTREGKPKEEIREELEKLNLGRLRIASKGIVRDTGPDGHAVYQLADAGTVRREGMFMIGQVAALRGEVCTIEQLHRDVGSSGTLLKERAAALLEQYFQGAAPSDSDIAIVGLSCVFPQSNDVRQYWQNIVNKRYTVREIPKERFDSDVYFNADRRAKDKIYSRWGGFIDDVVVDPMKFGMPPSSLPSIDPLQLVTLEMVHRALWDAGYGARRFNRENTCCVVGTGGGVGELGLGYGIRSMLPYYVDQAGGTLADSTDLIERMSKDLPEWTEDSFAGLLLNVVAGRVANRFDFGGTNFIVDAACATGLAALRHGVTELETRSSDVAVVAASDMMQSPFTYLCFSKTQALSPTGQPRVFDETADGIVISEGVACAVLKRLNDALLDGDKIYGVIKSVGASSDGKDKGLTAPRAIGQTRALERAYKKAGADPETVGLLEAHGTGTAVGDRTEAEALTAFFKEKGSAHQTVALGSVKSMIGHAKCAAGFAGVIKATMALRHRVLPSTLGVTKPNAKAGLDNSPLYINSETRPWVQRLDGAPRRAGISAFGFGGTNFHVVAEEFRPLDGSDPEEASLRDWPAELFLWREGSPKELSSAIGSIVSAIQHGARPSLVDLASAVYWEHGRAAGPCCLAVVAQSLEDLTAKLESARSAIDSRKEYKDPKGIYFSPDAGSPAGKIAFTFPGQGSQYVGMMNDLAVAFPEVRAAFEEADRSLGLELGKPLSSFIFPPPVFSEQDKDVNENALRQTNIAQPALGAADLAMFRLLTDFGVCPQFACGHSYGEFAALAAAGAFTLPELIRISELRGRVIVESAKDELGAMAAVEASEAQVAGAIKDIAGVVIANLNAPSQTVISGTKKGIAESLERLKGQGLKARLIAVACAFHSPLVATAKQPLRNGLTACDLKPQRFAVYSNTTAAPHPGDANALRQLLADHLARPVRFMDEIQAMYEAGARVFVECGPGRVLTGLVSACLGGRPHVAVHMDQPGRGGLVHLVHALAHLAVAGVPFYATRLFEGRVTKHLHLGRLLADTQPQPMSPTAWVVSNGRAVPGAKFRPAWTVLPANLEMRTSGTHVLFKSDQTEKQPPAASQDVLSTNPVPMGPPMANNVFPPNLPAAPARSAGTGDSPSPVSPLIQPPAIQSPPASQLEMVMQGHHRLMNKFLETHRNIMLACLQPQAAAVAGVTAVPAATSCAVPAQGVPAPIPALAAAPAALLQREPAAPLAVAAAASAGPPPVTVPASVPAPASPRLPREEITRVLLELVSQRTGYPAESLDVNLDLEGDLGVDSIKRVEIFSALQSESMLPGLAIEGQIETLYKLKTLRAIVDWIEAKASEPAGGGTPAESADAEELPATQAASTSESPAAYSQGASSQPETARPVTRLAVEVVDAPLTQNPSPCSVFLLVTNDRNRDPNSVAAVFSSRLNELGIRHCVVDHAPEAGTDLNNAASVAALLQSLKEKHGVIGGLVHLLPIAPAPYGATAEIESRTLLDLRSLFLLAKGLEQDLRSARGGILLSATKLGGTFGFGSNAPAGFFPGNGAISGFVKTVAREWPEVAAKTVDFAPAENEQTIARGLAGELLHRDGNLEVGYSRGSRKTLRPVESPLTDRSSNLKLDHNSVVLITGGARGITAATARELAQAFQPRLVLLGRSPLPQAEEPADIAGITGVRQLRAALMDRVQTGGQRPNPAFIEGIAQRVTMDREIRNNLAMLRSLGSEVEYHSGDVCDAATVGNLIESMYRKYGRIDGVVHGAGLIEDKLIGDKTLESFDRVVRPKIAGTLALVRALRPQDLQFLVFFSSVAARYGNRGQCDYSAANEVLNKMAVSLNAQWPGRAVSFNWGPWKTEGGMVSNELAARFSAAGVELIEVSAGRQAFLRELMYGRKQDSEVVYGGPLTTKRQPADT
ncbi:MAG: SDR family NAD(P)-dependent oxidoreductase, partial [Bryobacterales bacterium]|nr:SDR family NAD(P)-dependent oxidoreductase [Bryobacterales bacterium]